MIRISRRQFLCAAGVLPLALAGCGAASSEANTGEETTFRFFNMDGSSDPWTDPVAQVITQKTGVRLKTEYPSRGRAEAIELMLAGNDYPDLIFAKESANKLIEAGALIDLEPLIDEYGPNIKALYGADYEYLRYSAQDTAIYQLCSNSANKEVYTTSGSAQLQWAVLKENNYKIPYTISEYGEMLSRSLAAAPEIDGKAAIGISLCCSDWHWYITLSNPATAIGVGAPDNGQWLIDDETGKATYVHASEGHRRFIRWLNSMYHEGVLDPEFATQTHDDYLRKIAEGRVLGLIDSDWDYRDSEKSLLSEGKTERTYASLPVTMDESMTCSSLRDQGLSPGWGVGITTACKDPVKAVQFLNWLCGEEGQVLLHWGIEGVNYTLDENGRRVRSAEETERANSDVNYSRQTGVGFHAYPFPSYGYGVLDSTGSPYLTTSKDTVIAAYNAEEQAACEAWGVELLTEIFPPSSSFPEPKHSAGWTIPISGALSDAKAALDDIAQHGLVDCIICAEDEFDACWDELQQELAAAGREEAEAEMTAAVQAQTEFWASLKKA